MVSEVSSMARWVIDARNLEAEDRLVRELGIPRLIAAVLAQRGYTDPEAADKFLHPRLEDLNSPTALPDYEAAVKAILNAKERKELIFIHGDYDVDGVTSASIFARFLQAIGCEVKVHVPHRMKEGYGIHISAVDDAIAAGAKLFLTCDCGSGAIEQIEKAREAGMTVVVTDHHTIGSEFPNAHAFVNPHRHDSTYPFPELSGAGVAFKVCEGITREVGFKTDSFYRAFLDLAALGTIADVMPLVGENRIIARYGLERLGDTKKIGLQTLKQVADIDPNKPIRAYHVGFVIGPRLNATGRIDDAAIALRLLLTNDGMEARELAQQIEKLNQERRAEQDRIIEEAVQMVVERQAHLRNVIVVSNPGWHTGIVGIVAGRLVERFHRPVFVLNEGTDGRCKGSARTIPGFHLADAIRSFPTLMEGGGHAAAAGCSFPTENLSKVEDSLHEFAGSVLSPEDLIPSVHVDMEVDPNEINFQAAEHLSTLEPFGCENPTPSFVARGVRVAEVLPTKNPAHVRLRLQCPECSFDGIAFNLGERFSKAGAGISTDLIFQPTIDEWNGRRNLKLKVSDFVVQSSR